MARTVRRDWMALYIANINLNLVLFLGYLLLPTLPFKLDYLITPYTFVIRRNIVSKWIRKCFAETQTWEAVLWFFFLFQRVRQIVLQTRSFLFSEIQTYIHKLTPFFPRWLTKATERHALLSHTPFPSSWNIVTCLQVKQRTLGKSCMGSCLWTSNILANEICLATGCA